MPVVAYQCLCELSKEYFRPCHVVITRCHVRSFASCYAWGLRVYLALRVQRRPPQRSGAAPRRRPMACFPQRLLLLAHLLVAEVFGQGCRRVGCSRAGDAALVQHSQASVAFHPGCAAPSDRAAIRCCGGTGGQCFSICAAENAWALATHFRRTRQPRTCAEPRRATHDEAVAECNAQGLRLCSEAELDSCCKTGCQADKVPVWRTCTPNECHLAVTPRTLTNSPTNQPNQPVQPSICRRQSNSMQGLSAREFYCTHGGQRPNPNPNPNLNPNPNPNSNQATGTTVSSAIAVMLACRMQSCGRHARLNPRRHT